MRHDSDERFERHEDHENVMTIDCDRCLVRGPSACGDCVVTVLLGGPPQGIHLDAEEWSALDALASGGLVPPLRLVTEASPERSTRRAG